MLYNYALVLHILQQNVYCSKALDKLEKYRSLMDEITQTQFIWLRLENYFNTQSPNLAIKFIGKNLRNVLKYIQYSEAELYKDDNKNTTDANRTIHEIFQLRTHLQANDVVAAIKVFEKFSKTNFSTSLQFIEAHVLYYCRKLMNALQCLTSNALANENANERDMAYYWNNLGCIYFHLNKHNVGTMYFNRSLSVAESNKKNKVVQVRFGVI